MTDGDAGPLRLPAPPLDPADARASYGLRSRARTRPPRSATWREDARRQSSKGSGLAERIVDTRLPARRYISTITSGAPAPRARSYSVTSGSLSGSSSDAMTTASARGAKKSSRPADGSSDSTQITQS